MYERHGQFARGSKGSATYTSWANMVARCTDTNRPDYRHYGGRGISICEAWRNSFPAFVADMGERPEGRSLDRIDNELGYEPGNCRWATKQEQMQNTRGVRLITFAGQTMCLRSWARQIGITSASLHNRIKRGWPIERALTTPRSHV